MALAVALSPAARATASCQRRSSREPAFEIFAFDTEVVGGQRRAGDAAARLLASPLDEVLAAITPRTRVVFLTNPNNPTGVSMPLEAIRADRAPRAAGRGGVRRRGVRRVRRRDLHSRACRTSRTSSSAGRSRRRTAWPACASAALVGSPATLEPLRACGAGLQRQRRGRRRGAGGARGSRVRATTTCGRSASRRRCCTPPAIGWG